MFKPMLTVTEVADAMKVTTRTVGDWIRDKKLRASKVGRDWRINPDDLTAFINASANVEKAA